MSTLKEKPIAELQKLLDDSQFREDTIWTCRQYTQLCDKKDDLQDKVAQLAKSNQQKTSKLSDLLREYDQNKSALATARTEATEKAK